LWTGNHLWGPSWFPPALGGIPRKTDKPGSYTFAVRVKDAESPAQIADQVLTINLSP
jgi:hypothetical protein